jgi:hypothetical protein
MHYFYVPKEIITPTFTAMKHSRTFVMHFDYIYIYIYIFDTSQRMLLRLHASRTFKKK